MNFNGLKTSVQNKFNPRFTLDVKYKPTIQRIQRKLDIIEKKERAVGSTYIDNFYSPGRQNVLESVVPDVTPERPLQQIVQGHRKYKEHLTLTLDLLKEPET